MRSRQWRRATLVVGAVLAGSLAAAVPLTAQAAPGHSGTHTVSGAEIGTDGAEIGTDGAEIGTNGAEIGTDGAEIGSNRS